MYDAEDVIEIAKRRFPGVKSIHIEQPNIEWEAESDYVDTGGGYTLSLWMTEDGTEEFWARGDSLDDLVNKFPKSDAKSHPRYH